MTFTKLRKSWINCVCIAIAAFSVLLILMVNYLIICGTAKTTDLMEMSEKMGIFEYEGEWLEVPIDFELDSVENYMSYDTITNRNVTITKIEKGNLSYKFVFDCNIGVDKEINYSNTSSTKYNSFKINDENIEPNNKYVLKAGNNHIEIEGTYLNLYSVNNFFIEGIAVDINQDKFCTFIEYSEEVEEKYITSPCPKANTLTYTYIHSNEFNFSNGYPKIGYIITFTCLTYLTLFVVFEIVLGVESKKEKRILKEK